MDTAKLNDWIQVIGIVAIVASLIFVGLQLRQSHEIALATQYQARAEATMNLHLASIKADWIAPVPALRNGLSDDNSARDINLYLWLWIQFDNHFYQHQAGFLEESMWQAQLRNIRELYSNCTARFAYEWRKIGLRSEFVELVESGEDPCPPAN